jgi:hypothetical protein
MSHEASARISDERIARQFAVSRLRNPDHAENPDVASR